MPVLLRRSSDIPASGDWDFSIAIGEAHMAVPGPTLPGLAFRLEAAFGAVAETWWDLARRLQETPSAELAHAACCNPSPSDLGEMLAWDRLVGEVAAMEGTVLVVSDDPWLFRQLETLPGVSAGRRPALVAAVLRRRLRGLAARTKTALRMAWSAWATRRQRANAAAGQPALLVYGHGASRADGTDVYFGDLLATTPALRRVLHTDAPPGTAASLAGDGRTSALHAWGSAVYALWALPFARWRPRRCDLAGRHGWLVRRAVVREGATGAPAMTRWQKHCQARWLRDMRPRAVIWPWENQPWERPLVRAARAAGVHTAGYLHTIVGHHMWNQSPRANRDGLDAIPDTILCNGPGYAQDLERQGMPPPRMEMAGAYRFSPPAPLAHDPDGPVFVALSGTLAVTAELMRAVADAGGRGRRFLVKEHPMYPYGFRESEAVRRTTHDLYHQPPLAAVVYAASAVGLEAHLAGLPVVRFVPSRRVATDILPPGIDLPAADASTLADTLASLERTPPPPWEAVFRPVDPAVWRRHLDAAPKA